MAEAIRDGLRLEAIAAEIAGDGDTALELLSVNASAQTPRRTLDHRHGARRRIPRQHSY
jgi:hypothetical protein